MEDTAENLKVENTAGIYTYREHIMKLFTRRSREDTAKYYKNGKHNRDFADMEDTGYKHVGDSIELHVYSRSTAEKENEDPTGSSPLKDTAENSTHRGHSREFYCTVHRGQSRPS